MYQGTLFKKSWDYANARNHDAIFILSAKHHLLNPNKRIKPYDVTLSKVPKKKRRKALQILSSSEKVNWGMKVVCQLEKVVDLKVDRIIVLAGKEYTDPIMLALSRIQTPLKGLRYGEQCKYLRKIDDAAGT